MLAFAPGLRDSALDDQQFFKRAVRYMAEHHKIEQFLVIGYGLPGNYEIHYVAREVIPKARVVYAAADTMVNLAASALIVGSPRIAYINGDPRNTESILYDPATQDLINFSQPIGLVFAGSLNYIPDADDPWGAVHNLLEEVPRGSCAAISHVTADGIDPATFGKIESVYNKIPNRFYFRTYEQTMRFFADWPLEEPPGLVHSGNWSVKEEPPVPERVMYVWAGVARKP